MDRTDTRHVTAEPTMTVEGAARYLGISRAMAYTEAERYRHTNGVAGLPNFKMGRRVLVITSLLTQLVHPDAQLNHDRNQRLNGRSSSLETETMHRRCPSQPRARRPSRRRSRA